MLAETSMANVESNRLLAEGLKTMGEGLKPTGEGMKACAASINNLANTMRLPE